MRLTARDWGWRHAGRDDWAVRGLDLDIESGERVLLLGASGAGKSTLLHALGGVLGGPDEGTEQGQLLIEGRHPTRQRGRVGLLMQDPDSQVVLERVGDDVAFGCENLGVGADETWRRVDESLAAVGLEVPLDRCTSHLSGGQKQRLALAGALAMHPGVLLLDEPTANLDPTGVSEVTEAVGRLVADRGTTLVVVEHRVEVWAHLVDRVVVLAAGGGVLADGSASQVFDRHREELLDAGVWVPGAPLPQPLQPGPITAAPSTNALPSHTALTSRTALLEGRDLTIGHLASAPARSGLQVVIPDATSTMVTGPNGIGKSTLALTLAGLLPALGGRVVAAPGLCPDQPPRRLLRRGGRPPIEDPASWASTDLLTRMGTVFQNPEHQFVAARVDDEVAVGLRALAAAGPGPWDEGRITERVDEVLALLRLDELRGVNPFTLSGGEKRRLSVATVLVTAPRVVFLDEPTFGQDRNTWLAMTDLVRALVEGGSAVVSVTHDADFIATLGQHRIELGAA